MEHRSLALSIWVAVLSAALYAHFHRDALSEVLMNVADSPGPGTYAAYLALGCIRGFTLVPVTYLVAAGMLVLPPICIC